MNTIVIFSHLCSWFVHGLFVDVVDPPLLIQQEEQQSHDIEETDIQDDVIEEIIGPDSSDEEGCV